MVQTGTVSPGQLTTPMHRGCKRMWPFKKKPKEETQNEKESPTEHTTVADGINWKEIMSEGNVVELFDGCKAKSDGIFGDL